MESMNRETKRRLQRQGQLGPDGEAIAPRREPGEAGQGPGRRPPAGPGGPGKPRRPGGGGGRTSPGEFFREVRNELKKVAWPTRAEVANYASVVLVTLVILTSLIFALDFSFAKTVLFLFKT